MGKKNSPGDGDIPFSPQDLSQFTGTTAYYTHWLRRLMYTDGVRHFAERARAYWFLEIVATEVMEIHKMEPFIMIKMTVKNDQALITATDGNDRSLWSKKIYWTDCPPPRGSRSFPPTRTRWAMPTNT